MDEEITDQLKSSEKNVSFGTLWSRESTSSFVQMDIANVGLVGLHEKMAVYLTSIRDAQAIICVNLTSISIPIAYGNTHF